MQDRGRKGGEERTERSATLTIDKLLKLSAVGVASMQQVLERQPPSAGTFTDYDLSAKSIDQLREGNKINI